MKTIRWAIRLGALVAVTGLFSGCESTGNGSGGAVYYGVGVYDPWYYGSYYNDVDVVVPPPGIRPHPEVPVARPLPAPVPRPTPAIPSGPRPMPRRR
jgi:hypothetical protein